MAIYEHEVLIPLEPNKKIWRYLDLEKFKSLLEKKSLFFCRANKFSDPFEGSIPKKQFDFRIEWEKWFAQRHGKEFDEAHALSNIAGLQNLHKEFKNNTIINCWHINENESDAMWRLYLKDNEGVAIQSTTERIYNAINETKEKISLSKVRYIDYENDGWYHPIEYPHRGYNFYIPLIHKRKEFIHENEFRLFIEQPEARKDKEFWDKQESHKGRLIPINLDTLIDKIYLPPTIDEKSATLIKKLTIDSGYGFEFAQSKLSSEPIY